MREETKSIGFACALGAFVGALLALEFKTWFQYGMYLWPIGAFIGGSVAYVAVDFREFCSGVARAYRTTIAWKPNGLYWRAFGAIFLGANVALVTFLTIFFMLPPMKIPTMFEICSLLGFTQALALVCVAVVTEENKHDYLRAKNIGFNILKCGNPFGVACIGLWLIVRLIQTLWHALFEALRAIPIALILIKQFVTKAFIYVHSSRRTICFVDSILGATAGFFYGSVTIGAFVGAVLGMANYELVSVRWLKLVPVEG